MSRPMMWTVKTEWTTDSNDVEYSHLVQNTLDIYRV